MRSIIVCLSVIVIFITVSKGFSQDNPLAMGVLSTEAAFVPVQDPAISEIIRNINNARITEDMNSQRYWESKLDELTKPQIIKGSDSQDPFISATNK